MVLFKNKNPLYPPYFSWTQTPLLLQWFLKHISPLPASAEQIMNFKIINYKLKKDQKP